MEIDSVFIINLAKRGYCNAGICLCVCVSVSLSVCLFIGVSAALYDPISHH